MVQADELVTSLHGAMVRLHTDAFTLRLLPSLEATPWQSFRAHAKHSGATSAALRFTR